MRGRNSTEEKRALLGLALALLGATPVLAVTAAQEQLARESAEAQAEGRIARVEAIWKEVESAALAPLDLADWRILRAERLLELDRTDAPNADLVAALQLATASGPDGQATMFNANSMLEKMDRRLAQAGARALVEGRTEEAARLGRAPSGGGTTRAERWQLIRLEFLLRAEQWPAARAAIAELAKTSPGSPSVWPARAYVEAGQGKAEAARAVMAEGPDWTGKCSAHPLGAAAELLLGGDEARREAAESNLARGENDAVFAPEFRLALAKRRLAVGDSEAARALLVEVIDGVEQDFPDAKALLAKVPVAAAASQPAVESVEMEKPGEPQLARLAGEMEAAWKRGSHDEALAMARRAWEAAAEGAPRAAHLRLLGWAEARMFLDQPLETRTAAVDFLHNFWRANWQDDARLRALAEQVWRRLHQLDPLWPADELPGAMDEIPPDDLGAALQALLQGPVPVGVDERFLAADAALAPLWRRGPSPRMFETAEGRAAWQRVCRAGQTLSLLELLTGRKTAEEAAPTMMYWLKHELFCEPQDPKFMGRLREKTAALTKLGFPGEYFAVRDFPALWQSGDETPASLRPPIEEFGRLAQYALGSPPLHDAVALRFRLHLWAEAGRLFRLAQAGGGKRHLTLAGPEDYARHALSGVLLAVAWEGAHDAVWAQDAVDWDEPSGLSDALWRRKLTDELAESYAARALRPFNDWVEGRGPRPAGTDEQLAATPHGLLRVLRFQWEAAKPAQDVFAFYEKQRAAAPWALSVAPEAVISRVHRAIYQKAVRLRTTSGRETEDDALREKDALDQMDGLASALASGVRPPSQGLLAANLADARRAAEEFLQRTKNRSAPMVNLAAVLEQDRQGALARAQELVTALKPVLEAQDFERALVIVQTARRDHSELNSYFRHPLDELEARFIRLHQNQRQKNMDAYLNRNLDRQEREAAAERDKAFQERYRTGKLTIEDMIELSK